MFYAVILRPLWNTEKKTDREALWWSCWPCGGKQQLVATYVLGEAHGSPRPQASSKVSSDRDCRAVGVHCFWNQRQSRHWKRGQASRQGTSNHIMCSRLRSRNRRHSHDLDDDDDISGETNNDTMKWGGHKSLHFDNMGLQKEKSNLYRHWDQDVLKMKWQNITPVYLQQYFSFFHPWQSLFSLTNRRLSLCRLHR